MRGHYAERLDLLDAHLLAVHVRPILSDKTSSSLATFSPAPTPQGVKEELVLLDASAASAPSGMGVEVPGQSLPGALDDADRVIC